MYSDKKVEEIENLLNKRKIFNRSNRVFRVTDIEMSFRKCHFHVLGKTFGLRSHVFPLVPHERRQFFILRTPDPSPVLHSGSGFLADLLGFR